MQTYIKDCDNVSTKPVYTETKLLNLAEYLKAARSLIESPENWTQGTFARNKSGETVRELDPNAVCFCSVGALLRAKYDLKISKENLPLNTALDYLQTFTNDSVEVYNDSRPHHKVLELFDQAIAKAELSKPS